MSLQWDYYYTVGRSRRGPVHITLPDRVAALVAALLLFGGPPVATAAPATAPTPQSASQASAHGDTVRTWTPCRRTLASCVSKTLGAMKLEPGEGIDVDGRLDEELWGRAAFASDFTQRSPNPGAPPTEHTEFSFVYTETALYVGARMYSQDPSEIRAIISSSTSTAIRTAGPTSPLLSRPPEVDSTGTPGKMPTISANAITAGIRYGARARSSTRWGGQPR